MLRLDFREATYMGTSFSPGMHRPNCHLHVLNGSTSQPGQLHAISKYKCVSLFSGAGGLDLGLWETGLIDFVAHVEVDNDCRETLIRNNSEINKDCLFSDISLVDPIDLMSRAEIKHEETFILAGGPPCQAFSTAGLRQATSSKSGYVVNHYFEMVKHIRPRFFVFENVRGLLSAALRHRPLSDRMHPMEVPEDVESRLGSVMNLVILPAFKRLGYEVVYGILNSANYGTAQTRIRVVILGSRDKEFNSASFRKQTSQRMSASDIVPATHHFAVNNQSISRWRTLRDAIGHLADRDLAKEDAYTYSKERAAIFRDIPAGKNWKFIRDNPQLFRKNYLRDVMGVAALNSGGGKEGYFRRLSWDRPAPTLTAQPQQLASSLCHPDYERPLSLPEYAALQDFPEDYVFYGSKSSRYRQIGNAVPLRMARAIGESLISIATKP